MIRTLTLLIALTAPVAAYAQSPAADWRTISLPHFRVHYPARYEAWATRAAERLESIRTEVSREIGFTPPQTIDVLITNPVAEPNGSAWPLLDAPRMIFFAEPPGPDEQLGAYGHWIDLLAVHETAHLVHMLRPSRNPLARVLEKSVVPLNPITLRAPRWVLEGYATVIEGRLTGAGRPTSTIRALILRRWAESGRLPSYGQLNSDQRFMGMSMAYLMGSAYLEWLERRTSAEATRSLWARMTARQRRTFDEAFAGVFGESPERLYGQFTAELTASAMTLRRSSRLQEGVLFQETTRASGEPAVSPDGSQLAVVIRAKERPDALVIWSTAADSEAETKYAGRIEKMLERDPEDVAPVRTKPLPRKATHTLMMPDGGDIRTPRWTRDGKALLFAHRVPDAEGVLHFDLFRWDLTTVTRVTTLADVRDADPLDAASAVAVRSRFGTSQLVTVDLATGAVSPRGEASIDHVITAPRVSPDGTHIAQVVHRGGRWTLLVDDQTISLPGDPASPAWLSDTELLVTVFARGFAELHRVALDGTSTPVTRAAGGAFDAAPAADGRLFFTSLNPDGYVIRMLERIEPAPAPPAYDAALIPALAPLASATPPVWTTAVTPSPRRYGIGRQEWSWFSGQNYAPDFRTTELGLRFGDVVGRLNTLILGSLGDEAGAAIATAWRGWPVEVRAHGYRARDDDGVELRGIWSRRYPRSALVVEGGTLAGERSFAGVSFTTRQIRGASRFEEGVRLEVDDDHYRAVAGVAFRTGATRLAARYQRDGGQTVTLGGLASSLRPRSAYALRVLDPALPVATLTGDEYDGWRVESTVPGIPFTAFYQRHDFGVARLSLAGIEAELSSEASPILKLPGFDLVAGAARIFDDPFRGDTNWWVGMRWRP